MSKKTGKQKNWTDVFKVLKDKHQHRILCPTALDFMSERQSLHQLS